MVWNKKKIPLVTNEEVDMDMSTKDDSPVLWIRLDLDSTLIRYNVSPASGAGAR